MRTIPGLHVERWSGADRPGEEALRRGLEARGLRPYAWSNGPGYVYAAHRHAYTKHLTVARGGIRFTLEEHGGAVDLAAGDSLVLPAGVLHGAIVGAEGVTCLEAQG